MHNTQAHWQAIEGLQAEIEYSGVWCERAATEEGRQKYRSWIELNMLALEAISNYLMKLSYNA